MIQALLANKVSSVNGRDPFEVEDLLTSVVIGGMSYLEPAVVLLPFLAGARTIAGEQMPLPAVVSAHCSFWPQWPALLSTEGALVARRAQPEVAITLTDAADHRYLLVIEAKLWSGITSPAADDEEPVGHQLARYLLHADRQAKELGARSLGVIYLTPGLSPPVQDVTDALQELETKALKPSGRLWWLSWRRFDAVVPQDTPHRLLADLRALLRSRWGLHWVETSWCWPPGRPPYPAQDWFRTKWQWPETPTDLHTVEWSYA